MTRRTTLQKNPTPKDIDPTLREFYENDDELFPVRFHYTAHNAYRQQLIHLHWHQEMEFLLIDQGTMEVTIENHSFIVSEDDVIIIPPRLIHGAMNVLETSCAFYAFVFNLDFLASANDDLIQQQYISPLLTKPENFLYKITKKHQINGVLVSYLKQMISQNEQRIPGYELEIKIGFFKILSNFYLHRNDLKRYQLKPSFTNHYSNHSYVCKRIIHYIENNFGYKISLDDIANYVDFTPSYFCRFFKKHFKTTFAIYLNQYRLRHAEYQLMHTNKKIIDIAIENGFSDANYFASFFKKITGMTPTAYRNKHQV